VERLKIASGTGTTFTVSDSGVSSSWDKQREAWPRVSAALFFWLCAVAIAGCLLKTGGPWFGPLSPSQRAINIAALASPLIFLRAGLVARWRPRSANILGLIGGLLAMPWFVSTELSLDPWSSWVLLIHDEEGGFATLWQLRIVSVILIVVAVGCTSIWLLPARFRWRTAPMYRTTWPSLVLGFVCLAGWFVHAASPYLVPVCTRGLTPEFQVLHIEKRGLQIRQTVVSAFRDAKVYVSRDRRWLFGYRFERRLELGVMPGRPWLTFAQSPQVWKQQALSVKNLLRS